VAHRIGGMALDLHAATALAGPHDRAVARRSGTRPLTRSVTIQRDAFDLHRLWRDPRTQATIWARFASIVPDGEHLLWTLRAPGSPRLVTRWTDEEEGERLAWSAEGSVLPSSGGQVVFRPAPGDRGTEVTVMINPDHLAGVFGAGLLRQLPRSALMDVMSRFRALAETGDIPRLEPLASGRRHH